MSAVTESGYNLTSRAVFTSAFHSILGKNVRMKSGLNSASLISSWTFWNTSGKLLVLQSFAWQAKRLWVTSRTIWCCETKFCVGFVDWIREPQLCLERRSNTESWDFDQWSKRSHDWVKFNRLSGCVLFLSSTEPFTKMRPPSPSIPEKDFLYTSLKESLRLDGRSLLEQRKPEIRFGPELGYVECSLGKTRYEYVRVFDATVLNYATIGLSLKLMQKWSSLLQKDHLRARSQFIPKYHLWHRASMRLDGRYVSSSRRCGFFDWFDRTLC